MTTTILRSVVAVGLLFGVVAAVPATTLVQLQCGSSADVHECGPGVCGVSGGATEISVDYYIDFTDEPIIGGGTDFFWDPAQLDFVSWTFEPTNEVGRDAGTPPDGFDRYPDDCEAATGDPGPNCYGSAADGFTGDGEANGLGWGEFGGVEGPGIVGTLVFGTRNLGTAEITMANSEDAGPSNPGPFVSVGGGQPDVDFAGITVIRDANTDCIDDADADGDGIVDASDNCPNTPNPAQDNSDNDSHGDACDNCRLNDNEDQCNTNSPGALGILGDDEYGNACDADINNDGVVNSFDLSEFRQRVGQQGPNDADFNCDNIVNSFDLSKLRSDFGGLPGPGAP